MREKLGLNEDRSKTVRTHGEQAILMAAFTQLLVKIIDEVAIT